MKNIKHTRRVEKKANSLSGVASQLAKSYKVQRRSRSKRMTLLIHFTPSNGYDDVAPLLIALKRKKHGVMTSFVRQAIVDASKSAVDSKPVLRAVSKG